MRLSKRLAYAGRDTGIPRKPERKKMLYFGTAAGLVAFTFLADAHARIKDSELISDIIPPNECRVNVEGDLGLKEKVVDTICSDTHKAVLTNRTIIIQPEDDDKKRKIKLVSFTKDISRIIERGIIDWDISDKAAFFLTADDRLAIVPYENEVSDSYCMSFETKNMGRNRMIYFSGFLFIAPFSERIRVVSFTGEKTEWGSIANHLKKAGNSFFISRDRLFFGKEDGRKIEIRVEGEKFEQIKTKEMD